MHCNELLDLGGREMTVGINVLGTGLRQAMTELIGLKRIRLHYLSHTWTGFPYNKIEVGFDQFPSA